MAIFQYKTRDQEKPQEKPRVYFCCDPESMKYCFNSVCDEILEIINCAVWYPADANAVHDDQYLDSLKQMQLFVVPVTEEFLFTKNQALEIDFPFAIENHIPVLPILFDNSLVDDFNRICGNLQYVNRNDSDQTAISYEDKLKKMLLSVLVSDELAEKIRAAFDAKVFLSYRKKDRKYAQELMRLIHRNDLYRDIAIWYDEFLVPGENFDNAIQNAITDSDLFILMVTPSVVEAPNYIITNEYPMAKGIGKTVLPLEILPTDKKALEEKYLGLSDCIDALDQNALVTALAGCLKDIALAENCGDPEHSFFIGLAYLGGVDVEVDHKRGFELIDAAAADGLPQAMEKLVEIYRNGIGVKTDYFMAMIWQEELIKELKKDYDSEADSDNFNRLFSAYMQLGELCGLLERTKEAKEAYKRAGNLAEYAFVKAEDNDENIKAYAECAILASEKLAELCADPVEAYLYYGHILHFLLRMPKNTDDIERRRKLAIYYQKYADYFRKANNYQVAQENFGYALEHAGYLMGDNCELTDKTIVANIYKGMAGVFLKQKKTEEAKAYYEEALNLFLTMAIEVGSVSASRNLADCYAEYLELHKSEKNRSAVKKCYLKIFDLHKQIEEKEPSIKAKKDLAKSALQVADLYLDEEDFKSSESYYQKAIDVSEALWDIIDASRIGLLLYLSYMGMGNLHKASARNEDARKYYLKAYELVQYELTFRAFSDNETLKLIGCLLQCADEAISEGDFDRAKELCYKADSNYDRAYRKRNDKYAQSPEFDAAIADIFVAYGDLERAKNKNDRAANYYEKANLQLRNYRYSSSYNLVEKRAEVFYRLYTSHEKYAPSLDRAIECYEHLTEECPYIPRYKRRLEFLKGLK